MQRVEITHTPRLRIDLTEEHVDHLDEVANNRGISRAALMRKWLAAGERAEAAVIPDFEEPESIRSGSRGDPVEELFRSELPDNADEAVSIDELRQRMKERIDGQAMKLYREMDDLGVTDRGDVYADE